MKKFMMKYLMANCSEATMLMAKKEEGKLSLIERLNLFMHTSMCSICRRFEKQSSKIGSASKHIHAEENLDVSVKKKIEQMFEVNRE